MTKPFFSIIIPALNEEKYLPNLLSDLAAQSFHDYEVIIVDGNSKDGTVSKAKTYTHKLPSLKIYSSPRRHVCAQRNQGALKAKAETLIFMDADNRLPPYFLQGIKYRYESRTTDILTTYLEPDVKNRANRTIALALNTFFEIQKNNPRYLLESLIVINKSCFESIGGFDETTNYAEGKTLIHSAISSGFHYTIVKDPAYSYSFRRLRKFGSLKFIYNISRLELEEFLGLDPSHSKNQDLYPMLGGSFFEKANKGKLLPIPANNLKTPLARKRYLKKIQKVIDKLLA